MRAALLALALCLAGGAGARAATYEVHACVGGGGTGVNRLFAPSGDAGGCVAGSGLFTRSYPVLAPLSRSAQVMTAPPGTTISGYSIGWAVWWSSPVNGGYGAFVDGNDEAYILSACTWAGCTVGLPASGPAGTGWVRSERYGLTRTALRLATQCGGSWCTSGYAEAAWSDIHVELSDGSAPSVTAERLDGWITDPRTVAWSAADNSGIRRARLYVDGQLRSDTARPCDYSYRVPCSDAAGSFTVDPAGLADGIHTLEVRALDATDANSGTSGPTSFLVDTHGPVTTVSGQGAPDSWQPGPVTVTLRAQDSASGVSHIDWSLDGGAQHTAAGDETGVEVAGDGAHTIAFRAYDVAGNPSAEQTVSVVVGSPVDRIHGPDAGFSDHAANPGSTFTAAPSFD